ncbi:LOW QUALITY PROTEIN: predicted DNA-binding protein [Vibrio sp. JCM 18904]|nr:LOW QUALITY PROTEIN: predicted DNA-binding protein [Vibrio sp. JCM 18904]
MSIEVIAVRLTKGMDLKLSLAKLVEQHGIKTGSIASCVGCVSHLNLRLAGAESTLTKQEPFEIVSVMGTRLNINTFISRCLIVKDEFGGGGHLLEDTVIDTTAELIIHSYSELEFTRAMDDSTGYTELQVNPSK